MKKVLLSIWFLALIIAVPVIVFLPDMFSKYKANLLSKEITDTNINHVYFEDLDGDGSREKISCHKNSANKLAFQLHSEEGAIKHQENFNYNYNAHLSSLYFGDINKDNQLEIYGFTLKADSLFLNWFESATKSKTQKSIFISKVGTFDRDKMDISIQHFEVVDLEKDNKNEILISIEAGYSIHPRVLVVYKPDEKNLIRSADKGLNCYTPFLSDLDNDGKFEIITSSAASDNLYSATGVSGVDDRPWLQVFDSDLKHFFEPVAFSEGLSNTTQTFVIKDGNNDLFVFNCNRGLESAEIIQLIKYNRNGKKIDSRYLPEHGKSFPFEMFQTDDEFLIYAGDEVMWVNNDLKVVKHKEIAPSLSVIAIDTIDNFKERIYIAGTYSQNELVIYTEEFNEAVHLLFENERIKSVKTKTDTEYESLFVRTDKQEYYFSINRNNLYFLKFPAYFIIYILSVVFIWLIQKNREKQLTEKFELQNRVRELQLKTFRNQLNPHFIFNTFNGVASVIKKGDNEKAYDVFMRFSKMVRHILENFDNDFLSLKQELELVVNYIELQKFRYKELFEYEINIEDDSLNSFFIPRMIVQIHIENAIKHGLIPRQGGGKLAVEVQKKEKKIRIIIEDNGIGREKSAHIENGSVGIGLKTIKGLTDHLNKGKKQKITQEIVDLIDPDGSAAGTRVVIIIPEKIRN